MIINVIVLSLGPHGLEVRLMQQLDGSWDLPGVKVASSLAASLDQLLTQQLGIVPHYLGIVEQLYTFDQPGGVHVAYLALGRGLPGDFFPLGALPSLPKAQQQLVDYALHRLRGKITYTNIVFALLPARFTLSQLQAAYEAILGKPLDKRNFRKKFLSLGLIESTETKQRSGAHRPARLYRFLAKELQTISRTFD